MYCEDKLLFSNEVSLGGGEAGVAISSGFRHALYEEHNENQWDSRASVRTGSQ